MRKCLAIRKAANILGNTATKTLAAKLNVLQPGEYYLTMQLRMLYASYLATFTALFSRITVTFICPGYVISV